MRKFAVAILITSLLFMAFTGLAFETNQTTKLNVVATTTIVGDVVAEVGGDLVEITTLMGVGVDPHDFLPSAQDTQALDDADFVFFLGGGVEEGLEDALEELEEDGKAEGLFHAIPEADRLEFEDGHDHDDDHDHLTLLDEDDHDHEGDDPHFWHDPVLMKLAVSEIAELLSEVDTERGQNNNATYEANAAAYNMELDTLHDDIEDMVDGLNDSQKVLVTAHSAFNYWAERYGFESFALEGLSTSDEAGLEEIDELAQEIVEDEVKVIFTESATPDDGILAVIDAAEALDWKVVVGGTIFTGSLGDGDEGTYIGMMEYNAETITDAIANPPEDAGSIEAGLPISPLVVMMGMVSVVLIARRMRR